MLYDSIHVTASNEVISKCKMHNIWLLMIKLGHLKTTLLVAICNSWSYFMAFTNKKEEQKHETELFFFLHLMEIISIFKCSIQNFCADSVTFHFMFDDSVEIGIASGYFSESIRG